MSKSSTNRPAYRIFISYSHDDFKPVKKIVKILENNGLFPLWDKNFSWGHGFQNQIKLYIEHAHVFMPIISESSSERGWVHQEIGYAMAYNIPVLPIAVGDKLPGQMIQELQAIIWDSEKKTDQLKEILSWENINNLINLSESESKALYECAYFHQDRTMMLVDYAKKVNEFLKDQKAVFRQVGALSSFHLPNKFIRDSAWRKRIAKENPMEFNNHWLRKERRVFELIAKRWGFKIIINPYLDFKQYKDRAINARISRLTTLLDYLKGLPENNDGQFGIVINKKIERDRNLMIVGDLFMAESMAGKQGKGYQQTIFTRHAISIQQQIELFDSEFEDGLKTQKTSLKKSLAFGIKEIEKILVGLKDKK